jgi:signal transduction histidine kinase
MENAIRHGGTVTRITSSWSRNPDHSLSWIIEDDGVGIPPSMKKIFFRGK